MFVTRVPLSSYRKPQKLVFGYEEDVHAYHGTFWTRHQIGKRGMFSLWSAMGAFRSQVVPSQHKDAVFTIEDIKGEDSTHYTLEPGQRLHVELLKAIDEVLLTIVNEVLRSGVDRSAPFARANQQFVQRHYGPRGD